MKTHDFSTYSTGEVYDMTQTDDSIGDGDLFVCNGGKTVGFLMRAWPTLLSGERGELEQATPEGLVNFRREYPETFAAFDAMGR